MRMTYSYLDLYDVADHLKIAWSALGIDPAVTSAAQATATIQDVTFTAYYYGPLGNTLKVQFKDGATAGKEAVTIAGDLVTVLIASGTTTGKTIIDLINGTNFMKLVASAAQASGGNQSNAQVATSSPQSFANGNAGAGGKPAYNAQLARDLVKKIYSACQKVESIIHGPVMNREFAEQLDSSNTNILVPSVWPITKISEIRIDYNRVFADSSLIESDLYFIRGEGDERQVQLGNQIDIRQKGTDIVLRDDHQFFLLGRLFAGSILGSVQIRYNAGWALTLDDIPADIQLASMQLVEWFYFQRENRDLGIKSKGVRGESYQKMTEGIPQQIYDLLDRYTDVSLGSHAVPQRNYFST